MKLNYLTLSIFLLIILLCCVTMIYQYRQNLDKNDILLHQSDLLKLNSVLKKNTQVQENFESLITNYDAAKIDNRLLITNITIEDGPPKQVKITGKKLDEIKEVYFGEIKANDLKTVGDSKFYSVPNLNDDRFSSIVNFDDIISLEIKLVINNGENKDSAKETDAFLMGGNGKDYVLPDNLDLKEDFFESGYSKEFKITFSADYEPFRGKTGTGIQFTYRTQEILDRDGIHHSVDDRIALDINSKKALKMYEFMKLKRILELNNNFKESCEDKDARKKDTNLDDICKKKYDNLENDIEPDDAGGYTILPANDNSQKSKLKILINGIEFEIEEGDNTLFFTLDGQNYNKNLAESFGKLHFEVHPEFKDFFEYDDDVQLTDLQVSLINNETNVLIPTGLYLKPGLNTISTGSDGIKYDSDSWSLELKKKLDVKSSGGSQLVDSVNQFYQDTLNIITPPAVTPPEPISYAVRDFAHKINGETREYEFTWKPPTALEKEANLENFFYYFIFEPTSGDPKDTFKYSKKIPILKEQPPTETKSVKKELNTMLSFSYDRLLPLNEYKYSFMVSTNRPQIKILDDSQTAVIQFRPDGLEDYHTHLFDPKTGKFQLEKVDLDEIKRKQPELMQTYYQMVAYNQRVAEDEIRNSQLNMADSTKCVKGHTDQFMYGDMGSAFTQNLRKFLTDDKLKEGPEFKANQEKQEKQIESIEKKLEELEEHHGKKVSLHDLQINTLKSLQDGSLIRIEEIAGEKKLIKLNDGCVAYNKNLQYGAKDDYGYVPCNLLDTEQHFTLNKINNLDEYNFLLSSNLKPRIDPNEDNKFQYPFYTVQPTDSVKCVNIEDGKFQIRPCEDNKSIKFQGFFNKDECNV